MRAFQADDIEAVVALLTEDVWLSMPPIAFEWQGRERAREVLRILEPARQLVAARANGQPAFGCTCRIRVRPFFTALDCWCSPWRVIASRH